MGDTFYCDNYEELTGRERDGSLGPAVRTVDEHQVVERPDVVETKVIEAPEPQVVEASPAAVETA